MQTEARGQEDLTSGQQPTHLVHLGRMDPADHRGIDVARENLDCGGLERGHRKNLSQSREHFYIVRRGGTSS